jgi:hypothetical protein
VRTPRSLHQPGDPGVAHEPFDALSPDADAELHAQLGVDARRPVHLAILRPDLADLLGQPRVAERPI